MTSSEPKSASVKDSESLYRTIFESGAARHLTEMRSVAGAFEWDNKRYMVAAVPFTPDYASDNSAVAGSYLIGVWDLDVYELNEIAERAGLDNVYFAADFTEQSIPIEGPFGFAGYLAWEAELPGALYRETALPWVLAVCSVIVFLTSWLATHFRSVLFSLERLHKVATTDHLTGVANRAALTGFLDTFVVEDALSNGAFAAISIDLDDFKNLNDELGHRAGDTALRIAAHRITKSVGKQKRVFRMGGDEFLCIILDPEPGAAAQLVVDRLKTAFKAPMDLGGASRVVAPSIGVAISEQGEDWDTVLERSDAAMYRAKRRELLQVCA